MVPAWKEAHRVRTGVQTSWFQARNMSAVIRKSRLFAGLRKLLLRGAAGVLYGLVLVLGRPAGGETATAKTVDLTELPIEALMNMDVPKVYAASKIQQKTTEAPS